MSAKLESGFGDWLYVMFQMLLLRLAKLAAVSGSLSLFLILNHFPSVVNLHHVVPNLRSGAESFGATNCRSSHIWGWVFVVRCISLSRTRMEISQKKILVVYFYFWLEIVGCKTLLFTVVWHLCPDMKTRKEKIFIWAFQNNKKSLF